MAPILFDVAAVKEKKQFGFTFGDSKETSRWTKYERFNFKNLSEYLKNVPKVGQKDGRCYTPAAFKGNTRTLQDAMQIDVAVLDSDCGHELEQIRHAIAHKGWRAIVHSTYSHLTDQTVIAASAYRKWHAENPTKTVGDYMINKKGFLPKVVEGSYIVDETAAGQSRDLVVQHAPCPKFRILLPLDRPWLAEDYESQDLANAKWRERIGALAYALGLNHDQSCSDTSRLFYFPRVKNEEARDAYVCEILNGEDCDIWSLPDAEGVPSPGLFDHYGTLSSANVVALPIRDVGTPTEKKFYIDESTGEIFDLTQWVQRYGIRFEIVKAVRTKAPHLLSERKSGVKQHIFCPRSGDHMTGGHDGTGTFIVNASDLPRAGLPSIHTGFVIKCSHNGCKGVDRLDYIHQMLMDKSLSTDDLTNPEFLSLDFEKVDIKPFLNKVNESKVESKKEDGEPKHKSQSVIEKENSNIASYLYKDLPGVLGAIHKYILDTSPKPQPVLAMGAALALCASAIGQRVKLEKYGTRPNIYVLGVGVSGCGKDRPMSACKQIARAAGLHNELIGVEDVASDTGIVTAVAAAPRQLMVIDEASILINAVNDPRSGAHLKGVVGVLLKLYSTSDNIFKGKSYADRERNQTIDQPCVSLLGASTPRGLGDSLTNKDIESGLLSRVVIFDAGENDPRIGESEATSVPEEIVEWLTAWNSVKPIQNIMERVGGDPVINPRTVMLTDEALKIAVDFEGEMHDAKGKARKNGKDALYVRGFENALKFALIRACSIWPVANAAGNGIMVDESALKVDAPTMRWAVDLSRATVARMLAATNDIADTPYEQSLKALRKAIQRAGVRGMTQRDLVRIPAGRMSAKALNELLTTLADAGEIAKVQQKNAGKGRPREPYVHKQFHAELNIKSHPEDDDDDLMAGE